MGCKQDQSPEREKSLLMVEFLQVAITSVVFVKGIYPIGAFERRRYMNLVVHSARHPQLHRYIHDSLHSLVPFFQQGIVERVAVIFFKNDKIPIEKFVFKINVNLSNGAMMEEDADLEASMRSFLIKLSKSEPLSKTSSQGAFERRRCMNLVVHSARHPQLHRYIHDSLHSLVPFFQQGIVERVAVIVFKNDKIPIEKFVFKINVNLSNGTMMEEDADLEASMRSFLIKHSQSEPLFKTSSQGKYNSDTQLLAGCRYIAPIKPITFHLSPFKWMTIHIPTSTPLM